MNRSATPFRSLALLILATPLACAHAKPAEPPAVESSNTNNAPAAPAKRSLVNAEQTTPTDDSQGRQDLDAALAALKEVDLFFGFNDDALTADARTKLSKVADVLSKHPTLTVHIDGNCDERGTTEFNIALGQKRADSAKKYLVDLGVKSDQVSTLSYGKERPRDPGHDEKAWQENRRDDVSATPAAATQAQ